MFTCHISFVKRKYPGGTSTENTHSKLSPEVIHPQAMQKTMGSSITIVQAVRVIGGKVLVAQLELRKP